MLLGNMMFIKKLRYTSASTHGLLSLISLLEGNSSPTDKSLQAASGNTIAFCSSPHSRSSGETSSSHASNGPFSPSLPPGPPRRPPPPPLRPPPPPLRPPPPRCGIASIEKISPNMIKVAILNFIFWKILIN